MLNLVVEVLLIAVVYYWFIRHLQATRGGGLLAGFIMLLALAVAGFSILLQRFELPHIEEIADAALPALSFGLLVIFQPELRLAISRLGSVGVVRFLERLFGTNTPKEREKAVNAILAACDHMSRSRTGAIIVIQRSEAVEGYQTGGLRINAEVSERLLETIFYKGTPLHDGAVLIISGRIMWAASHLHVDPDQVSPIEGLEHGRDLGTRHRAAFSLSQQCDAVIIVVSEETGRISIANQGRIQLGVRLETLRQEITRGLHTQMDAPKARRLRDGDRGRDAITDTGISSVIGAEGFERPPTESFPTPSERRP